MNFINPIEILGLAETDIGQIDNSQVKKARRKVQAEIDLSDDSSFDYHGAKLGKSRCEEAIDELEDEHKKEFYYYLATENAPLNNYLASGDEKLFASFKQESIYKNSEFIKFVSPYFSERFDKSLFSAFKASDPSRVLSVVRAFPLVEGQDVNVALGSVSKELQSRIDETERVENDIKSDSSSYTESTIPGIVDDVRKKFPAEILNNLPSFFFQSQLNKAASAINFLLLAVDEKFTNTKVPLDMIEHVLSLNLDSVGKPIFVKNKEVFAKRHNNAIEEERNAPLFKQWKSVITKVYDIRDKVEDGSFTAEETIHRVNTLFSVDELNRLPSYADQLKDEVGYAVRSLAIASWNKQEDINTALTHISTALKIYVSADAKEKFLSDEKDLHKFEEQYRGILTCFFCGNNKVDNDSVLAKTIYKETNRTYFPRRVEFQYVNVNLPRCQTCKEIHSKGRPVLVLLVVGFIAFGSVVGYLLSDAFIFGVLGGLGGLLIGLYAGRSVTNAMSRKAGIKDLSTDTLRTHPLLIDRMKQGWTFNKPSA